MLKKLRLFGITMAVTLGLLAPGALVAAPVAYAIGDESRNAACEGIGLTGADCDGGGADKSLNGLFSTIVNILSVVVGVAAVIMIIVGGFKYVTSGGDANKATSARNTIIYAIIGLIIVALARIIINFVVKTV